MVKALIRLRKKTLLQWRKLLRYDNVYIKGVRVDGRAVLKKLQEMTAKRDLARRGKAQLPSEYYEGYIAGIQFMIDYGGTEEQTG